MSEHAANLGRAARLLRRIADIDGPREFEGVPLDAIIEDVLIAQRETFMREAYERTGLGGGRLSQTTAPENVIPFPDQHSRRVKEVPA